MFEMFESLMQQGIENKQRTLFTRCV